MAFLSSIACAAYFFLMAHPALQERFQISEYTFDNGKQLAVFFSWLMLAIIDLGLYRFHKKRLNSQIRNYETQVDELLKSKRNLQGKAQTYADHSNKLKLFISDRLLDFIEYDEKYLHFKNIASEVRHNGVISYDKVNSALRKAMRNCEQADQLKEYQQAIASMMYLWDLLDLSTTDNIAMSVSDKLYQAEEQYYQLVLNRDIELPYSPLFSLRQAMIHTLQDLIDETLPDSGKDPKQSYIYEDERYYVELHHAGQLLGNENYIHLMVENLLNNAQYYANQRKYKSKYHRMSVNLEQSEGEARISVYGPGPLIGDDIKDDVFKLGFSTKRTRDNHHGKGLGLYFISEIVKGYEGRIGFTNILNHEDELELTLQLADGKKQIQKIDMVLNSEQQLDCRKSGNTNVHPELELDYSCAIAQLEIRSKRLAQTLQIRDISKNKKQIILDPANPASPQWMIELLSNKNGSRLLFKPLNVNGVQFTVTLPTAASRLDPEFHVLDEKHLDSLQALNEELDQLRPLLK